MAPLDEITAIAAGLQEGAAIRAVAVAIFPRLIDRSQSDKVAAALLDLTAIYDARILRLEARVAELEKHSHPPIDLTPLVRAEIDRAFRQRVR